MTTLGIIGAMQVEVDLLLKAMDRKYGKTIAGSVFYEGTLEGLPCVIVQCGVGKVNAAICAQILCDCFGVTHLVNTGIAGSLNAQLDIGDLVVSQDAMYHDFDCVHFGYEMGRVPGMDVVAFPADENMIRMAYDAAQAVHPGHIRIGRVASGDLFVAEKCAKERIIAVTGALCTEMEGAAIAQVAYVNRIPCAVLRAISDNGDEEASVDYPTFVAKAALRSAEVLRVFLKNSH